MTHRAVLGSLVGPLALVVADGALTQVRFLDPSGSDPDLDGAEPHEPTGVLAAAARQLDEYFDGSRRAFDLPLAPRGSAFQQRVWAALLEIPFGGTVSYGEIARRLGMPPTSSRAVGAANGANPIPVVIPCHRVIGADGLLTGYGGGLHRKEALLRLEGVPTERDQLSLFD